MLKQSTCHCKRRFIETSKHKQCIICQQFDNQQVLLLYQYDLGKIMLNLVYLNDNRRFL